MKSTPRRRWFRFAFSLRTLFVVVTIFGVWLGWQRHVVQERKAIIREIERTQYAGYFACYGFIESQINPDEHIIAHFEADDIDARHARLSFIRRFLGDESCVTMVLPEGLDQELLERIENAFPEAALHIAFPPGFSRRLTNGAIEWAYRDSLYVPADHRRKNTGTVFKTGLIEK